MKHALALVLLLAGSALSRADATPLAPADFVAGFAIEAPAGGAIYRLPLGLEVYRSARRADLGDIRVFNAAGEAVPHAVRERAAPAAAAPERRALPLFPLAEAAQAASDPRLLLSIDANGAILALGAAPAPAAGGAHSYILDAGPDAARIARLVIGWEDSAPGLLARLTIESSSDLAGWQPAGAGTLADLEFGGQRLRQDAIDVQQPLQRYLRLRWTDAAQAPLIARVEAELPGSVPRGAREQLLLEGNAGADAREFLFDAGGALPVDAASVVLDQDNSLARVRWSSRASADSPWRERGTQLAWRLARGEARSSSGALALESTRERYWRIEVIDGDAAALGAHPRVRLDWLPDELLFVARGAPPFQLAAGSARADAPGRSVDSLIEGLAGADSSALTVPATLGARHMLGGEAALVPPPPPVPWQRYLLWALLVGAVLVLGRMAVHMLKELGARDR